MMNIQYATSVKAKSMLIIIQLSLQGEDSGVIGDLEYERGARGESGDGENMGNLLGGDSRRKDQRVSSCRNVDVYTEIAH